VNCLIAAADRRLSIVNRDSYSPSLLLRLVPVKGSTPREGACDPVAPMCPSYTNFTTRLPTQLHC